MVHQSCCAEDAGAQSNQGGVMYQYGVGTLTGTKRAYMSKHKAASSASDLGAENKSKVSKKMTPV